MFNSYNKFFSDIQIDVSINESNSKLEGQKICFEIMFSRFVSSVILLDSISRLKPNMLLHFLLHSGYLPLR